MVAPRLPNMAIHEPLRGEEWEFVYDSASGEGVLRGSDVDWKAYRVVSRIRARGSS